uniref:nucleoporin NDC1-like n=1 Tax=Myxine glutinosa TaxID=7769 RepID=UPI00358EB752
MVCAASLLNAMHLKRLQWGQATIGWKLPQAPMGRMAFSYIKVPCKGIHCAGDGVLQSRVRVCMCVCPGRNFLPFELLSSNFQQTCFAFSDAFLFWCSVCSFLWERRSGNNYSVSQSLLQHIPQFHSLCHVQIAESSSQALFADGQAHIWAFEAVSHMVAASFTEDQYGVVQTNLSSILCTMVNLLEAIDKHFKLPQASNKPLRPTDSWPDASFKSLRFAVRSALRTALHRIANKFGHHLKAVDLSPEHLKRLQMFVDYKE